MAPKATRRGSTTRQTTKASSKGTGAKTASKEKARKGSKPRRWSAAVMKRSDALDLEPGVFKKRSPRQIALSLKRSAESSTRRKGTPYQSAMSMLNFHLNRGGKNLSPKQKAIVNRAKDDLRAVFGRS
jgi:hypothetical protein